MPESGWKAAFQLLIFCCAPSNFDSDRAIGKAMGLLATNLQEGDVVLRVATISLRAICTVLSILWATVLITIYVPFFWDNAKLARPVDFIPLVVAVFSTLVPISFLVKKGHRRETTMMVASVGWTIAMGAWVVSIYYGRIGSASSAEEVLRQGFPGNFLNLLAMLLFASNGLLSLRALRKGVPTTG